MLRTTFSPPAFALVLAFIAAPARAQFSEPGSLLVFPEYDTRSGHTTALTVTNTSASSPSVLVHVIYVDAPTCTGLDRRVVLTPQDSLSLNIARHSPGAGRGFVYAYAGEVTTGDAIAFDFLIGTVTNIDGFAIHSYSMNAFSFQSPEATGRPTDRDDDGIRDLDDSEYQAAPDIMFVPRFIGQLGEFASSQNFTSHLILIGLSGGSQFITRAGLTIFNDNEQVFSANVRFRCWSKPQLSSISAAFRNDFLLASAHDPMESLVAGRETGWFSVDGLFATSPGALIEDPAVLAVLIDPPLVSSSELPFTLGTQTNGDLLPTSVLGDP